METSALPAAIKRKALELGYDRCGIITLQDMDGYAAKLAERNEEYPSARPLLDQLGGFANVKEVHPWAEAIIVLTRHFAQYKTPEHLKGHIASSYLCDSLHVKDSSEYCNSVAFGEYLAALGIKAMTDRKAGLTAMRWAAMQAGLGMIRKNNFFYTEDGSFVMLTGWLIDRRLELKEKTALKPCPTACRKCIDACPTKALKRPYSVHPTACVAFMTGFGGDDLPADPASASMGGWIYGCDICQLTCPFNCGKRDAGAEYPGLAVFAQKVSLTQIIDMDYEEMQQLFAERFWYISKERLWKWKVNALNAMKNEYRSGFRPWIQKARNDAAEQVRTMAEWVVKEIESSDTK